MSLSKRCANCDESFTKPHTTSMARWTNQVKYCSASCAAAAKVKPATKVCPTCGQLFKPKHWESRSVYCSTVCSAAARQLPLPLCEHCRKPCQRHGRRFCSAACKNAWQHGANQATYVGEHTTRDRMVDLTWWKERAKEIRERDKVCQHCGMTPEQNGRALDVHHRIPYLPLRDNSPSNLIALCRSCHKAADHEYAKLHPKATAR